MAEHSALLISIETDTADELRKAQSGYSVYAVMEDYPVGHRKFLLRKTF